MQFFQIQMEKIGLVYNWVCFFIPETMVFTANVRIKSIGLGLSLANPSTLEH